MCGGSSTIIDEADPHFASLIREFITTISSHDGLDDRLRELCAVATTTAIDDQDDLNVHLDRCRVFRVEPRMVLEAVLVVWPFAGRHRLERGLDTFRSSYGGFPGQAQDSSDYPEGPSIDGYDGPALKVGIEMYGPRRARTNINNFRAWHPDFASAMERLMYAGVNRRRVLAPRDREICSVAVLAALHKPQLAWHATAALRLGATDQQLRWAVINQVPHVGFPPVIDAMRALDAAIGAWWAHPSADKA